MKKTATSNGSSGARSSVFVYGSLKAGFHNHILLGNIDESEYLGRAWAHGPYAMRDMKAYPGLYRHSSLPMSHVVGEVYRVTQDVLWSLDILEGNGSFYTRHKIPVQVHPIGSGQSMVQDMKAWCYFLPGVPALGADLLTSRVLCWRPTNDEHAFILSTSGGTLNEVDASAVAAGGA